MNIEKKVAEETGYSEEHVRFVIRRFWITIFFFMRYLEYTKGTIMIKNFVKISIPRILFKEGYDVDGNLKDKINKIKENEGQTTR